ncbi:MAG: hypothetical protein NTV86_11270 [Planctomycetota bacterium]|nr:hypothetical protein [Planctomycetota bacterium]
MTHIKATLLRWTGKILPALPLLLTLAALGLFLAGCGSDHHRHH